MSNIAITVNNAISYRNTSSALIDLFIISNRDDDKYINEKLINAWNENPELTVKIIFVTRDISNGKGERELTFKMLEFLRKHCFNTYKLNIKLLIVKYGRIKDLIDMALSNMYNDIEINILADIIKEDLCKEKPSLAIKWIPREGNANKKILYKLISILFPNKKNNLELYRKEILQPLNKKIQTIEQLMCSNNWHNINYSEVPSQAMKIYGREQSYIWNKDIKLLQLGAFIRHDKERFNTFLKKLRKSDIKINTKDIQPQQLVKEVMFKEDLNINLQWNYIIQKLNIINSSIENSIAAIDVSGSMNGYSLEVALALGLIITEFTSKVYKKKLITFSNYPIFHHISGETLHEKIQSICNTEWGMTIDIEKVFDLILNNAKIHNIKDENIIKKIFIFTNKQFNDASTSYKKSKTLFKNIKNRYIESKYKMPELIYWNLSKKESKDIFPIKIDDNECIHISGISVELLKVFMEGLEFNSYSLLLKLLEKYEVSIDEIDKKKIINNDLIYSDICIINSDD